MEFIERLMSVDIPPFVTSTEGGSLYLKSVQRVKGRFYSMSSTNGYPHKSSVQRSMGASV